MISQRKGRLFDNPGLYAFFLYYFASLINDAVVVLYGVGGLFTPRQIAIVLGIVTLISSGILSRVALSRVYRASIISLSLFYCVAILSYSTFALIGNVYDRYVLTLITDGANILWLVVVGFFLSNGLTQKDKRRLPWCFILLGLIPLLTGLVELTQGRYILRGEGLAESHAGIVFHVRGFHFDKVNYVTALAPAIFSCFLLISSVGLLKKIFLLLYFGSSLILVFMSYSTTGIVGVAGGLLLLFLFYGTKRTRINALFVLALAAVGLYVILRSEQGQILLSWYAIKIERQSSPEQNLRYAMNSIALREFARSPVWGLGFGNIVPLVDDELRGWGGAGNVHSILGVPADLGLMGAIPFFSFWGILYSFVFRLMMQTRSIVIDTNDRILRGLAVGFSVFVFARLLAYFHSMSDEAFIMFPALVYAISEKRMGRTASVVSRQAHARHVTKQSSPSTP